MEINPVILIGSIVTFLVIVALIPSKESRLLKKTFSKPISKLEPSLEGKVARIQGKVTAIKTSTTPIFNQQAVIYEAGFYTLSEREKRDPDFHSYEHNWHIQKSKIEKNDFLLEDNGGYALVKTSTSKEILNKTKNDINQYDIGFISSLNKSDIKFEDIKSALTEFMKSFELPRYAINNFFHYEVLRVKEQLLIDGNFVSVVGKCRVDDIKNHPNLADLVHPMTEEILVVECSEHPLYITDDMKTLYG